MPWPAVSSAPLRLGSRLIFDYIDADVITRKTQWKGARRAARTTALRGEPYRSGFSSTDVDSLFSSRGFECHEHARTPALLQRYAPAHVGGPCWQRLASNHHRAADLTTPTPHR
jgi:O-methyltransferase involved in polyketide biosynthesis